MLVFCLRLRRGEKMIDSGQKTAALPVGRLLVNMSQVIIGLCFVRGVWSRHVMCSKGGFGYGSLPPTSAPLGMSKE